MKVLAFGGYGFIGSYLTNFFSKKKFTIDIVVKKRSKKRNTNIIFNKLYEFNKLKLKDNYNCVFICSSKMKLKQIQLLVKKMTWKKYLIILSTKKNREISIYFNLSL